MIPEIITVLGMAILLMLTLMLAIPPLFMWIGSKGIVLLDKYIDYVDFCEKKLT